LELEPDYEEVNGEYPFATQPPEIERAMLAYMAADLAIHFVKYDIPNVFDLDSTYAEVGTDP
jgi:hypothetical protein